MIRIYTLPYRLVYCLTVSFPLSYRQTKICWKMWRAYRYLIDPRFPPMPSPPLSWWRKATTGRESSPWTLYIWAVLQLICNQMYLTYCNHMVVYQIRYPIEGDKGGGLQVDSVDRAGTSANFVCNYADWLPILFSFW